jgi:hypothetical protein
MSLSRTRAGALLLLGTLGFSLAGCADNCRPGRGWDRPDDRGHHHHRCDRHRGDGRY